MKKRTLAILLAVVMCGLPVPASVQAGGAGNEDNYQGDEDYLGDNDLEDPDIGIEDPGYEIDPEPDIIEAGIFIIDDIRVSPAKKTIKKGKTFNIKIVAAGGSEFDDLSEEEWYDIYERSVDSISFRSTKSSVAYVNRNGKVQARKRGSAVIKTTVNLSNGDSATFKTKVYVKK